MIDKATAQRIKDTANIVEVVSDYVHLTRRGTNYMGLCPFHNERTPSFSVSPQRNFCYCFSCHKGGSPVNFIMEKEGVSYNDALRILAGKYGIKIEERELTDEERKEATEREGLRIAAERAMRILEKDLLENPEGREVGLSYLYSRGVTDNAIRKFHLGYNLSTGHYLVSTLQREGFDEDTLLKLGLAGHTKSGGLYDKYRGRVIFPIMNSSGKVVGFGGRDLQGGPAKYINSPESALYRKNQELYGIAQAKNEIVRQQRCYLVEGYLDVISMWQSGLENVVASSGTALTDGQIAIIHRFSDNITLIYDGDEAGIKAALRGIDMLLSHKMNVSVLLLPDGHDPDSFARSHTPEEFRKYVEEHQTDIIMFKLKVLLAGVGDSPQKKAEAINSVANSIACIPNDVQRQIYVSRLSQELKLNEATVASAVERARYSIIEQHRRQREYRIIDQEERERGEGQQSHTASPANINKAGGVDGDQVESRNDSPLSSDTSSGEADTASIATIARQLEKGSENPDSTFRLTELRIVELIVKFGYLSCHFDDFTPADTANSSEENEFYKEGISDNSVNTENLLYTVVDLVNDQMRDYNLQFSYSPFKHIFDSLYGHIDDYIVHLDAERVRIEEEINRLRQEERQKIAEKGFSSVSEIERQEKILETNLESTRQNMLRTFEKDYPGNYLASHEHSLLRQLATTVLSERHHLSNLFAGQEINKPENDIENIVMRAVNEWRIATYKIQEKEIMAKLALADEDDAAAIRSIQLELWNVQQKLKILGKKCGERILSSI